MGGFYSLEIARSGLFTSQKAMEVTGHNMANANTKGYTRQRLELSSKPNMGNGKYSLSGSANVGGGVTIDQLNQIRDKYLDYQFRNENSLMNELSAKDTAMAYIENILSEPDHGISVAMDDVFSKIEELSTNAHDGNAREIVVQSAVKLTDTLQTISKNLTDYQEELNRNITLMIEDVNATAEQIRDLNKTIFDYEITGERANDLRDQRNLLVDSLSGRVNISVNESQDGRFSVSIGGVSLVDHFNTNEIVAKPSYKSPYTGAQMYDIKWINSTNKVDIKSGQLKGMLDMRDGNTENKQGIPFYIDRLDTLAQTLVEEFNKINNAGWTIPYGSNASQTNIDFFEHDKKTARDITVSDALLESGYNVAASLVELDSDIKYGNNRNIIKFDALRDATGITITKGTKTEVIGNIEEYFENTISQMAITGGYYKSRNKSQMELTYHIDNQRLSISEVSINEESTNMIKFQHSYSAAAKLITTIDEMLQTLINMV